MPLVGDCLVGKTTACENSSKDESNGALTKNGEGDDLDIKITPNKINISANTALTSEVDDSKLRILKVRIANSSDRDYIDIEVPRFNLSYSALLAICSEELGVPISQIERIRKSPCTRLRNDKDVKRLRDSDWLEIVLHHQDSEESDFSDY